MVNELKIIRGDTPTIQVQIISCGASFPLTGYTPYLTVKKNKEDKNSDAVIGPIVGTITDSNEGEIDFPLTIIDTDVEEGKYYYDVELVSSTETHTPINSIMYVELDVKK